jgi:hypothetical protein
MLFFYKRNALKSKSIPLKSNFKAPNAKVNIMFTLFLVVAKVIHPKRDILESKGITIKGGRI